VLSVPRRAGFIFKSPIRFAKILGSRDPSYVC
jgi:hypothetical protein